MKVEACLGHPNQHIMSSARAPNNIADKTTGAGCGPQSKFKESKFTSEFRTALLTTLYQAVAAAARAGTCRVATNILRYRRPQSSPALPSTLPSAATHGLR